MQDSRTVERKKGSEIVGQSTFSMPSSVTAIMAKTDTAISFSLHAKTLYNAMLRTS
jgi:hypothetical protein